MRRLCRPRGPGFREGALVSFGELRSGCNDAEVAAIGKLRESNANRCLKQRFVDEALLELIARVPGGGPRTPAGA
jgi:hypothetical protein